MRKVPLPKTHDANDSTDTTNLIAKEQVGRHLDEIVKICIEAGVPNWEVIVMAEMEEENLEDFSTKNVEHVYEFSMKLVERREEKA